MECTFTPQIVSKKRPQYFNNKLISNDQNNKIFYQRVKNAQKVKEEKNNKLLPNYNEKYDKMVKQRQVKSENVCYQTKVNQNHLYLGECE
jgi:hypothetical protein